MTDSHSINITMHGHKVAIKETQDASFAFIASQGAQGAKRRDSEASSDADIIIERARPIVESEARKHLRSAAQAGDWKATAAMSKRSMQLYRSIR